MAARGCRRSAGRCPRNLYTASPSGRPMKILLDLQGAQSQSRHRGIGRYTLALTRAFLEQSASQHDIRLLFNTRFDAPTDSLIATLGHHARPERRIMVDVP